MKKKIIWVIFLVFLLNLNLYLVLLNLIIKVDIYAEDDRICLMDNSPNNSNFELISSWHYSDHSDICEAMTIDSDGNFYLAGWDNHNWGDICVLKLAPDGSYLWHALWDGYTEAATRIAIDSFDNAYVSGYTDQGSPGWIDAILLKYDSSGDLLWERRWGGPNTDGAKAVAIDSKDDIYVVGYTSQYTTGGNDVLLLKYNSSGGLVWNRTWGDIDHDAGYDIEIDQNDLIYVTGFISKDHGRGYEPDLLLLKYNSSGDLLDHYIWGGDPSERGTAITLDSQSNIYIAGEEYVTERDMILIKLNSSLDILWNKTWGGNSQDEPHDIAIDNKGIIYVIGETTSYGSGFYDFFLITYNQIDDIMISYFWGDEGDDRGTSLLITSNNDLYLGGRFTNPSSLIADMVLLKASDPNITIISPTLNQEFGSQSPEFTISIEDVSPIMARWYTIDDGAMNYTFSGLTGFINQTAWDQKEDGIITIRFYANDSLGNEGTESVTVIKSIPSQPVILGYNVFLIIGAISVVSIIIIIISLKKKDFPLHLYKTL